MALSQLDQINKTQEGVSKLRESIPGSAYDPPEAFAPKPASTVPQRSAARPAVSVQPVMPKRSFPTHVSPDAEFKALTDELTAMSQFPGDGTNQRRGQIQAHMAQLTGQGGQGKQVKRTGTLNGRRVVEFQDGTKAFLN